LAPSCLWTTPRYFPLIFAELVRWTAGVVAARFPSLGALPADEAEWTGLIALASLQERAGEAVLDLANAVADALQRVAAIQIRGASRACIDAASATVRFAPYVDAAIIVAGAGVPGDPAALANEAILSRGASHAGCPANAAVTFGREFARRSRATPAWAVRRTACLRQRR